MPYPLRFSVPEFNVSVPAKVIVAANVKPYVGTVPVTYVPDELIVIIPRAAVPPLAYSVPVPKKLSVCSAVQLAPEGTVKLIRLTV